MKVFNPICCGENMVKKKYDSVMVNKPFYWICLECGDWIEEYKEGTKHGN